MNITNPFIKALALHLLAIIFSLAVLWLIGWSVQRNYEKARERTFINCEYQGAIVLENNGSYGYVLLHKGKAIRQVKVYDIDNTYQVGDTINKPCIK